MYRHLLLVRFQEAAAAADIAAVLQAFLLLKDEVAGLSAVEWGENDSPEGKNAGFTHVVLMSFVDAAARDAYLPHPAHAALKRIFRPVLADIIVIDYLPRPAATPGHGGREPRS
jgi:hypothetical protein